MQRNKKSQSIQSTGKLMKSKYLDSKKPTVALSNKIMLTDLCPQQKAKIGQLIKTLQQRKKQNQDLQQQLNSWKSNYMTLDKVKTQLQNLIQSKNNQLNRLNEQVNKLNNQKVQKDIQLHQLHTQLKKHCQKINLNTNTISFGINTNFIQTINQQTQTKQKKKKLKDREIQANTIQYFGGQQQRQTKKNNFYQPNSKTFDKIMKGQRLMSSQKKNYQTAAFNNQDHFDQPQVTLRANHNSGKHSKRQTSNVQQFYPNNQQLRQSELDQEQRNWSQYNQQSQVPNSKSAQQQIQVEDTQNDDDEFQMLAKKWLQLKQKNIQQLTQGYLMNDSQDPSINLNLKSLGIQSKVKNQRQNKIDENEEEVDEQQLNQALKSKDFSASRLLNNSRSKRNISQNSQKKSLQNSQSSYKNINSKYSSKINQNKTASQYNRNKEQVLNNERNIKNKKLGDKNSKGIDFYNSDLLDLVEEMNK